MTLDLLNQQGGFLAGSSMEAKFQVHGAERSKMEGSQLKWGYTTWPHRRKQTLGPEWICGLQGKAAPPRTFSKAHSLSLALLSISFAAVFVGDFETEAHVVSNPDCLKLAV